MRSRAGAAADQDVEVEVFERRVQHLFDVGQQTVDFVDEENLAQPDVAEDAGEIEFLLQHRAGSLVDGNVEFCRDNRCERGLTEAWRTVEQHVVHGFVALAGGGDGDGEILFKLGLTGEVGETMRTQSGFELRFFGVGCGGYDPAVGHDVRLPHQLQRAPE